MPWQLVHRRDLGLLETVYSGVVTPPELDAAVRANLAAAREHGTYRFLADCIGLEGGHSLGDLYAVVALLEKSGAPREMREAILAPRFSGMALEARAYETMCLNRGIRVRLFGDRTEALAWLCET